MSRSKRVQARSSKQAKPLKGKGLRDEKLRRNEASSSSLPAPLNEDTPSTRNRTGLPDAARSGIELLSGMSMDDVRAHYNSDRPAELDGLAYVPGTGIPAAPGQEQHLSQEAWHVVQQAQGRVTPTKQIKEGVRVNEDESLEHDADVMGARAMGSGAHSAAAAEEQKLVGTPAPVTRTGSEQGPRDAKES